MGADKPGKPDHRPLASVEIAGDAVPEHRAGSDFSAYGGDDDEDDVELSLEDEDLVRTTFATALAGAIGDKGLIDAPARSRQDRAQLVEVMQTDLDGREIEELHFIAMSFGFAATIELDPMMPEGHEGRVTVSLASTGQSYV